jgi:predicted HicB family RNase H-like nuclease
MKEEHPMARPKKGEEKNRSASLRFRVKEEVSEGLRAIAKARKASIADVAEEALEEYVRLNEKRRPGSKSKAA